MDLDSLPRRPSMSPLPPSPLSSGLFVRSPPSPPLSLDDEIELEGCRMDDNLMELCLSDSVVRTLREIAKHHAEIGDEDQRVEDLRGLLSKEDLEEYESFISSDFASDGGERHTGYGWEESGLMFVDVQSQSRVEY